MTSSIERIRIYHNGPGGGLHALSCRRLEFEASKLLLVPPELYARATQRYTRAVSWSCQEVLCDGKLQAHELRMELEVHCGEHTA